MKKFRNIPAIITLLAGFITCVIMIICQYSVISFLWILILVMVIFYVLGTLVRVILNRFFAEKLEENKDDSTQDENDEETKKEENDEDVKTTSVQNK